MTDNLSAWRIGGSPQNNRVLPGAQPFAWAYTLGGRGIFNRREYHSNIVGRHGYFDVSVANRAVFSHRESPHLLVAFRRLPVQSIAPFFTMNDRSLPMYSAPFGAGLM